MGHTLQLPKGLGGNSSGQTGGMAADTGPVGKGKAIDVNAKKFNIERITNLFSLDMALDTAYKKAERYLNAVLEKDDMFVKLQHEEQNLVGEVYDKLTGEMINSYRAEEVLRLYATNGRGNGVVVDGKI